MAVFFYLPGLTITAPENIQTSFKNLFIVSEGGKKGFLTNTKQKHSSTLLPPLSIHLVFSFSSPVSLSLPLTEDRNWTCYCPTVISLPLICLDFLLIISFQLWGAQESYKIMYLHVCITETITQLCVYVCFIPISSLISILLVCVCVCVYSCSSFIHKVTRSPV